MCACSRGARYVPRLASGYQRWDVGASPAPLIPGWRPKRAVGIPIRTKRPAVGARELWGHREGGHGHLYLPISLIII